MRKKNNFIEIEVLSKSKQFYMKTCTLCGALCREGSVLFCVVSHYLFLRNYNRRLYLCPP